MEAETEQESTVEEKKKAFRGPRRIAELEGVSDGV